MKKRAFLRLKNSKNEQREKASLATSMKGLKARIVWPGLFLGAAGTLIAGLLLGVRLAEIPEYKAGDIALQDVRAPQNIVYEDKGATAARREAARDRTPAIYDVETQRIGDQERKIGQAFADARQVLSLEKVPSKGRLNRSQQKLMLSLLEKDVGQVLPHGLLPSLLEYRFDAGLEKRIVTIVGTILRSGIVADPELFRQDGKKGILLRDRGALVERPLSDPSQVRSLKSAQDYLRQFHLDFAELSLSERAELFAFMETLLFPTLTYNAAETDTRRDTAAARVTPVEVQIKKGKAIVRAGEEISPRAKADLAALRNLARPRPILGRFLGLFFFGVSFLYLLWRYFLYFPKTYRRIRSQTALAVTSIVLSVVVMRLLTMVADVQGENLVAAAALKDPAVLYLAIPFSFAAVLTTILIDLHVGLIVSIATSALAGLFYGDIYLALYSLLGSLTGVYSVRQYRERSGLVKAGLAIGAVNALAACGIQLLTHEGFPGSEILLTMGMGGLSGVLATTVSSVSLPVLESLFKITTDIRLLELSNLNAPLLRRLAVEAPGTYHHSLVVGTLAEAAAEAIGANPLLVRVGAYYHDLGKVLKPEYFTENQAAGANRHEGLAPSMSRLVLAGHVKDGLEMAQKAGVAEPIRDLIPQHHGTRVMAYFYQKAKGSPPEKCSREEDFRYPGPKPQSKEAAILMMADSVEAASRTLARPSTAQVQRLIDRLIQDVLADDQLDECDITLGEIRLIKESFFKILTAIHHRRIDYPGYDFISPEKISNLPPELFSLPPPHES